jgi:hypothetical protein
MTVLTVEGTYENGKVRFAKKPTRVKRARVLITFLPAGQVDLRARGIDKKQAHELRARLKTFAADWNRPEMEIYDAH